jgi:hypothetical protein
MKWKEGCGRRDVEEGTWKQGRGTTRREKAEGEVEGGSGRTE